ncbi:MAG: 2'-deoxycytidine 5'-triphosphate deaminase [Proteobacteria bacterium]|nr:2'-deoxycytidine 5'-triphosphate deaminase [Pseudomonadota bacterium]
MPDLPETIRLPLDEPEISAVNGPEHTTGILPCQAIEALIRSREILSEVDILEDQIQPSSVDLRLGTVAYRVRASFLPGSAYTVRDKLDAFTMHKIDLTDGAVLEKGCVYIVPLMESLKLRARTSAMANPKSSTGRLDIFTRLITDHAVEFDRVEAGYKGPLYAEISPRTFSVLVRPGVRLSQLRLRRGSPASSDTAMRRLHERAPLVDAAPGEEIIDKGVAISVDLKGHDDTGIIGYRAKHHTGIIDVERVGYYEVEDYWEPIKANRNGQLILDPDDFYILASREAVSVPPDHAAEMRAYDTSVGEFRVHYAGFFDPGFGHDAAGGRGSRAVLEVRSHDVPFVLEHGQVVGRLIYERLTAVPDRLYGSGIGSNYQRQALKLSKHFK